MPAKTTKPKAAKEKKPEDLTAGKKRVGTVTHFFDKISVAVIKVEGPIAIGDEITIEGPQTNIKMKVQSMQIEHKPITAAKKGDDIGMKVPSPVRPKDIVFKV